MSMNGSNKIISIILSIILAIILSNNSISAENTWDSNFIPNSDLNGNINYISMRLDSKDQPHICYIDRSNNLEKNYDFFYIYKNQDVWYKEIIDTNDNVGFYCSIDIDGNDKPHVSYYDQENGSLKYAKKIDDRWIIQIVDNQSDTGYYSSIKIDNDNNPHISYYDGTTPYGLKYAFYNETNNWTAVKIDSGYGVGYDTSIDVDDSNNPRISYFDYYHNNNSLRYAYKDGENWFFKTVDVEGSMGFGSSLDIDNKNIPHISYHDSTNNKIKYAYLSNEKWITQNIEKTGEELRENCIILDSKNLPHITYTKVDDKKIIKHAYWNGKNWETQVLGEGINPIIDLRNDGYPYIIYRDLKENKLKEIFSTILISKPNGGETWYKGNIYDIEWKTDKDYQEIIIELTKNNEIYQVLNDNLKINTFSWNISNNITSGEYNIKIKDINNRIFATKTIKIEEKIDPEISINPILGVLFIVFIAILLLIYFRWRKR